MRGPTLSFVSLVLLPLLMACGGGGNSPAPAGEAPLVLAAGSQKLDPVVGATWPAGLDLARLGVGPVDAVYDVTTPADEPFVLDAFSRATGNVGAVRLSVAHASDGGLAPIGGAETLADAGVLVAGPGQTARTPWVDAHGDGFARVTVRGRIQAEQVIAVVAEGEGQRSTAILRVRLGPPSAINLAATSGSDHPGLLLDRTLYSSDSWMFGLPTLAVSGDRTSIVCYEGDQADPYRYERYELRLQHDALTDEVTGGATEEASPDAGNWRDHEIAALYNVLAIVRGGADEVMLALSFDRGATIGQTLGLGPTPMGYRPRLVQAAMALDYSLAVLFWRVGADGLTELVLVEGRPSTFDGTGSPTAYALTPAQVLHRPAGDVTPALMGAAWSAGGDLVIGYGFTSFTTGPDRTWASLTQNRCWVRRFGEVAVDTLIEENRVVGKDPSVALLGTGPSLEVFFAYEGPQGVRLVHSTDGGTSFGPPQEVPDRAAYMPTVLARPGMGGARVDLIYLTQAAEGQELHVRHWEAFGVSAPVDHRLTQAHTEGGGVLPPPGPLAGLLPPPTSWRFTQVAWLGYDALLDGETIVVVYDEETQDGYTILPYAEDGLPLPAAGGAGLPDGFVPAEPPPLAAGLTERLRAPDPAHRHQLRLLRYE